MHHNYSKRRPIAWLWTPGQHTETAECMLQQMAKAKISQVGCNTVWSWDDEGGQVSGKNIHLIRGLGRCETGINQPFIDSGNVIQM